MSACGAVSLLILIAAAAPPDAGAEEVVVSATRDARPASQTGASVTVIDAQAIALRQYRFAADALADAPGVSIARNGGAGAFAGARIRGAPGGGVVVIMDGVVLNDPSAPAGGYNFATLDLADVERIEVLRGPQSVLYGADALGGVVAITTKRGRGAGGFIEGGSGGDYRIAAHAGVGDPSAYGRLFAHGAGADGISRAASGTEKDGFDAFGFGLAAGAPLGDRWRLDLSARHQRARAEIDGFPAPAFLLADTDEEEKTRETAAAARFSISTSAPLKHEFAFGAARTERRNFDSAAPLFAADGTRLSAEYLARADLGDSLRLLAGAEIERVKASVSGVEDAAFGAAAFALLEAAPAPWLSASFGVRRDEYDAFKGATTARAALAATAPHGIVRASLGQGFRTPTIFQLNFNLFGAPPNPALRPERSVAADVGYELPLGDALTIRATLFRQTIRDLIDFDFAGGGYVNLGRVRMRGLEAEANFHPSDALSASVVYTLTDAIDRDSGLALLRQPRHRASAIVDLRPHDRLSFGATIVYNGAERDFPADNDAFMRVDLRAALRLSRKAEIFARIENAANASYQDVSGYAEAGRSLFAGARLAL